MRFESDGFYACELAMLCIAMRRFRFSEKSTLALQLLAFGLPFPAMRLFSFSPLPCFLRQHRASATAFLALASKLVSLGYGSMC